MAQGAQQCAVNGVFTWRIVCTYKEVWYDCSAHLLGSQCIRLAHKLGHPHVAGCPHLHIVSNNVLTDSERGLQ